MYLRVLSYKFTIFSYKDAVFGEIYLPDRILSANDRFYSWDRPYFKPSFYMARSIDPRETNEEKDMLKYSEHMSLLRQIIRIVIHRDRVKERQRNIYD